MKGARHQLLARAALASDQNRQVGADDTGHRLEDILHRARPADERAALLDTGLCLRRRPRLANAANRALGGLDKAPQLKRLRQIFEDASLLRLDRRQQG